MAGDVKVTTVHGVLSTSATGSVDLTETGFGTVKACIVVMSRAPSDDGSLDNHSGFSHGFTDFITHLAVTHQDEDNSANVDCDSKKSTVFTYYVLRPNGTVFLEGTASAITDGVRLINTQNTNGLAPRVSVMLIGGADAKIHVVSTNIPSTQDATATITPGVGFATTMLFAMTHAASIERSFGVCHINAPTYDAFTQRCMGWSSDNGNSDGFPEAILSTDRIVDIIDRTGGQKWGIEITAAADNSITFTTRDAAPGSGRQLYTLAVDIDDRKAKVGSVDSPISGATWAPSVSLGFKPQFVGMGLTHLTEENVIKNDDTAGALGVSMNAGSGKESFHGWYNEDAAATTNTASNFRSRVLDFRNDDQTVIVHDHSHLSFDSGGWTTTINTENETTAKKWFYWAFEEKAAVAAVDDIGWHRGLEVPPAFLIPLALHVSLLPIIGHMVVASKWSFEGVRGDNWAAESPAADTWAEETVLTDGWTEETSIDC